VPLLEITPALGDSAAVAESFSEAVAMQPCVVLIDDAHAGFASGGDVGDEADTSAKALAAAIRALGKGDQVCVVVITNDIKALHQSIRTAVQLEATIGNPSKPERVLLQVTTSTAPRTAPLQSNGVVKMCSRV
jgi:AAA+ superfamily predicted ATPase